jgi:hypothetical protein
MEEKTSSTETGVSADPVRPSGADNAQQFHDEYTKKVEELGNGDQVNVSIPGTRRAVTFSKVNVDGNRLYIWNGSDTTGPADFVIVNPPNETTDVATNATTEDPLTAVALILDGATQ